MKLKEVESFFPWCKEYDFGECHILVSDKEPIKKGKLGWHLSISHPKRLPNWKEIHNARYQLIPNNVTMAMILPPKEQYVNIHENCFHLFEIEGE